MFCFKSSGLMGLPMMYLSFVHLETPGLFDINDQNVHLSIGNHQCWPFFADLSEVFFFPNFLQFMFDWMCALGSIPLMSFVYFTDFLSF